MAQTVTPPRGMRDFLPADKARRESALATIRSVYRAHGFDEIETPALEDAARLHSGLGGDNEKLAFAVLRRGLSAEDLATAAAAADPQTLADLGLRFDLTVPLARFYATHRAALPPVFRSIQIAPVWRAERPQRGRYRQFIQCDIDVIGEAGTLAELELLTATAATLDALGLSGCRIRINDRRILTGLLRFWAVPTESYERALITIDKLDKIGATAVADELVELGIGAETGGSAGGRGAPEIAATLESIRASGWSLLADPPAWLDTEVYAELLTLRDAAGELPIDFDPTLVRGMGYYTGTIFEIAHPQLGYSLGGGGRYDGMVGRFVGYDVPACGFSIGFERIIDLLTTDAAADRDAVVLLHGTDADPVVLTALKAELIAVGKRVRLERRSRNVKATLARVAADGFGAVATVGAEVRAVSDLEFSALRGEAPE